jgi:hypothetical protein
MQAFITTDGLPWQQAEALEFILDSLDSKCREAVVAATNYAARKIRDRIIDAVAAKLMLPREEIASYIAVDAEATEGAPAARVRVSPGAIPLGPLSNIAGGSWDVRDDLPGRGRPIHPRSIRVERIT